MTVEGVDALATPAAELAEAGVAGITVAWVDNNGIPRSRTVPTGRLTEVARRGVAITPLFAVFDSHDRITFDHPGLSTPSGDVRLVPVAERIVSLAGQPAFAWAPGRLLAPDGTPWPYDPRTRLEVQVSRAQSLGLRFAVGFELEMFVSHDGEEPVGAHRGPAYSPHALLDIDDFAAAALADLEAHGIAVGQLHAEYGPSQVEVSLAASDPITAADEQVLARQTLRAAARRHGLRVSFAPLVDAAGVGNGCHIHTSVWRGDDNLLAGEDGGGGPEGEGAAYVAGLLRDLPSIAAVAAPSVPSLMRLRPGYFSSAFAFWGVENREAALRYVPSSALAGRRAANVELKPADASGNPYLALAAIIAAGTAGMSEELALGEPIAADPGTWSEDECMRAGVKPLPTAPDEQLTALQASPRVRDALGEELLGAIVAVRRSDAEWARDRSPKEIVASHLWLY